MNRVFQYKINKALAAGVVKTPSAICAAIGAPAIDERTVELELYKMFPEEFDDKRTPESVTIPEMLSYVESYLNKGSENTIIRTILEWEYHASACGCTGPQGDEPLCPCAMNALIVSNKQLLLHHIYMESVIENEQ